MLIWFMKIIINNVLQYYSFVSYCTSSVRGRLLMKAWSLKWRKMGQHYNSQLSLQVAPANHLNCVTSSGGKQRTSKMLCEKHVGLESSNPLRNGDCSYFFKLNKHMTFYGWRESISDCGKPSDRTSGLMDPLSLTPCILQYEFYNRFYRQWDADSSTV